MREQLSRLHVTYAQDKESLLMSLSTKFMEINKNLELLEDQKRLMSDNTKILNHLKNLNTLADNSNAMQPLKDFNKHLQVISKKLLQLTTENAHVLEQLESTMKLPEDMFTLD